MFVEVLLESLYVVLGDKAEMKKMMGATRVISFCLYKLLQASLSPSQVRPLEMNVNFVDPKVESIIERLDEKEDVLQQARIQIASDELSAQASIRSSELQNLHNRESTTSLLALDTTQEEDSKCEEMIENEEVRSASKREN